MAAGLVELTADYIGKYCLFTEGDAVLLSLSAGKDSMALYHVMLALAPELGVRLAVFHLNHGVRGAESDADETFLRELCARDGIPAVFRHHDFSDRSAAFEERAREVRYRLIDEALTELGCTVAATAHTASDQAETVLMRACTGTHVRGLEGISPKRSGIVRPLLFASSDEIYSFLRAGNIVWREDSSNTDIRYARNFLRHEIIPRLDARFSGSSRNIAAISEAAAESRRSMLFLLSELGISFRYGVGEASVPSLPQLENREVFSFCLAEIVSSLGGYLSRERIDEAYRRARSAKPELVIYEDGEFVVERTRDRGRLVCRRVSGEPAEWRIAVDEKNLPRFFEEGGLSFSAKIVSWDECRDELRRRDMLFISLDGSESSIVVRSRIDGDHVLAGGMTRKVKDLLIDAKCGSREKHLVPVVEIDGCIAAVGIGFESENSNRISDNRLVHVGSKKILAIYRTRPEC